MTVSLQVLYSLGSRVSLWYSPGPCRRLLGVCPPQSPRRTLPVTPGRGRGRTAGRAAAPRGASRSYPWCWCRRRSGGAQEEHRRSSGSQRVCGRASRSPSPLYRDPQSSARNRHDRITMRVGGSNKTSGCRFQSGLFEVKIKVGWCSNFNPKDLFLFFFKTCGSRKFTSDADILLLLTAFYYPAGVTGARVSSRDMWVSWSVNTHTWVRVM